jgi:hypothetical protein
MQCDLLALRMDIASLLLFGKDFCLLYGRLEKISSFHWKAEKFENLVWGNKAIKIPSMILKNAHFAYSVHFFIQGHNLRV